MDSISTEPTETELKAAVERGQISARAALETSTRPIFMVDEMCSSQVATAEAMGWNSIAASEENRKRWAAERERSASA